MLSSSTSLYAVINPANLIYLYRIVAVHGLGAHSEFTWTCYDGNRRIHLLSDLVQPGFPEARILSFGHNCDWLINAPMQTAHQIGQTLLRRLKEYRSKSHVRTKTS